MNLKRNGPEPLYLQVKDKLKKQIEDGVYSTDEKLPTERELCELFKVSRITIRQAIEEAVKEGILYREKSKGTFVANKVGKLSQSLEKVVTFSDLLKSHSSKGKTEILSSEVIFSDMETSSVLSVDIGTPLLNLKLVAYLKDTAVAYYNSLIVESEANNLLDIAKELTNSKKPFTSIELYQKYDGVKPNLVRQSIKSSTADGELAEILQVRSTQHLMNVTSVFLVEGERPIEYRKAYYLGDSYIFYITRQLDI